MLIFPGQVPQLHRAIRAGNQDMIAIGCKAYCSDSICATEFVQQNAAVPVEQPDVAVEAAGGDLLAIG